MPGKNSGRTTRPYLRARAYVLSHSDVCWICGHSGARTADHVIPRATCFRQGLLHLLDDPANMRPAHGSRNRCPTCGRHCNQDRGTGAPNTPTVKSRDW